MSKVFRRWNSLKVNNLVERADGEETLGLGGKSHLEEKGKVETSLGVRHSQPEPLSGLGQ